MKRTTTATNLIYNTNESLICINLGYALVKEHQRGIDNLVEAFGIPTEKELSLKQMRNTIVPENLILHKTRDSDFLVYHPNITKDKEGHLEYLIAEKFKILEDDRTSAAWDNSGFAINSKDKKIVEDLYDAFMNKNGIITLKPDNSRLKHNCLLLGIYSKMPKDFKL